MPKFDHLLIDLDGTLLDSKEGILKSVTYALKKMKLPVPHESELEWFIGPPIHKNFAQLFGADQHEKIELAVKYFRERYADKGMLENNPYPAIELTLAELKKRVKSMFVATAKPKFFADKMLAHCDMLKYFNGVYGSELNGVRGDKGELIAHLLNEEKINPAKTAMIGDRNHDILGAKKNGVYAIGISWGYGSEEEFKKAGADVVCETQQDLLELVRP